ncbi:MAG: type IX secretion system outer membrane channel protein PorV [Flavobacteriaceae bacterium]
MRHRFFVALMLITQWGWSQQNQRVITTGVPFLLITPDARAAGMGDQGVATSADAFSQQWNPAKYVFAESNQALAISYTPYLSKLVNDIFLGNLTYFKRLNNRSAWAMSLKYFSLGEIQFNDLVGGTIVNQGLERPNELTLDLSYALQLGKNFSMAVAGRYIRSDLKMTTDLDASSANTLAVDLAAFYQSQPFEMLDLATRYRGGITISNVGPRLKYDIGGQKNFLPTNLKLGSGLAFMLDTQDALTVTFELNKLLVPTPVAQYNDSGVFLGYQQPDINFLQGIAQSFDDAPDGLREELKEINWSLGLEYVYQGVFALRSGYFNESPEKGSRRFLTFGAGFGLRQMDMDISYLFSTSSVRSPLENTLRFSVTFDLGVAPEQEDP